MLRDLAAAINSIFFSLQWLNTPLILQESPEELKGERGYLVPPGNWTTASVVGVRRHNRHATSYCCAPILMLIWSHYHSPGLTLDIFSIPVSAQDVFLSPTTPQDLAESIYTIPTVGSSPSFSLFAPWLSNSYHSPTLISPAYGLEKRLFPDRVGITQSNIHFW